MEVVGERSEECGTAGWVPHNTVVEGVVCGVLPREEGRRDGEPHGVGKFGEYPLIQEVVEEGARVREGVERRHGEVRDDFVHVHVSGKSDEGEGEVLVP